MSIESDYGKDSLLGLINWGLAFPYSFSFQSICLHLWTAQWTSFAHIVSSCWLIVITTYCSGWTSSLHVLCTSMLIVTVGHRLHFHLHFLANLGILSGQFFTLFSQTEPTAMLLFESLSNQFSVAYYEHCIHTG